MTEFIASASQPRRLPDIFSNRLIPLPLPLPLPRPVAKMSADDKMGALGEKHVNDGSQYVSPEDPETIATGQNVLHRDLQGRHMQMIAM